MLSFLDRLISKLFYILLFATPLILWPFSSELFEFNKMVFVYLLTVLITSSWLVKCIFARKFLFRRTILDIPLVLFLLSLAISTYFSIDVRTSLLGYYSRFHGGLLSYLSYSLLYWGFVSTLDQEKTKKALFVLILSSLPVLFYGIFQHFGIDKEVWVQDVQNRIFSTLGQPNWLAAWVVSLMPIGWALAFKEEGNKQKVRRWIWFGFSTLAFVGLLFTKSRSGLLAFAVADLIFWLGIFSQEKRAALSSFITHHLLFFVLIILIGTPFTTNIPAPETGGTESGEIRKIVWQGAINLWKKYPLFGTGPETFAYSYYETRPVEHNLVSEWNFLYNKAHNEYLNFASTTGSLGLLSYLFLITAIIFQIFSIKEKAESIVFWKWPLLSGFISILISNFFGFSVVPVSLLFFLYPAIAVSLKEDRSLKLAEQEKLGRSQKIALLLIIGFTLFALYKIGVYWHSDSLYSKGKSYNASQEFLEGRKYLAQAVTLSPNEPIFWDELSKSTAAISVLVSEAREEEKVNELATLAISESDHAISLSPRNTNLTRNRTFILERLSAIEPSYLLAKITVLEDLIPYAPTDASLYYALGLTQERIGQRSEALKNLDQAITLKANYKNARFARALILINLGKNKEAREELIYILEKIEPNDNLVRQELEKIK